MRHNKKFNHLGRTKSHRDALLSNMACSLISHKRIFTTLAKAKALRMYVEPLINRAKDDTTASRRVVFSYLQNKEAVTELFKEISTKIADRPGGYTRILKTGNRIGDKKQPRKLRVLVALRKVRLQLLRLLRLQLKHLRQKLLQLKLQLLNNRNSIFLL